MKKAVLLCQLRDSGSVMYVYVHSFALALASLHYNLFERSAAMLQRDRTAVSAAASGSVMYKNHTISKPPDLSPAAFVMR